MSAREDPTATSALPAWRSRFGPPAAGPFDAGFFRRDVLAVARDLLGARVVAETGDGPVSAVLVEVEAYRGPDDPASHAATRAGRTERNRAMFGEPGRAYVYLIYGMHWCLNVVTGDPDRPQAVLLRGAEPLEGVGRIARRRGREPAPDLLAGPGRLCQGLAVDGELYGHPLDEPPLRIEAGWRVPDTEVARTGRIGVTAAADRPWRWVVRGSPGVSRAKPAGG